MKRIKDERLIKESNKLNAKMFYLISVLLLIVVTIQAVNKLPIQVYGLGLLSFVISSCYVIIQKARKGLFFLKEKDEVLESINQSILATGFTIDFWILIIGEFLLMFLNLEYTLWYVMYLLTVMIPSLIITIFSIKNGWLIWGGQKRQEVGKKELRKRVVIGALFFGTVMSFPELYHDGAFHAEGILWLLGMAIMWGVPFYFIFSLLVDAGEKKADKQIKEVNQSEK